MMRIAVRKEPGYIPGSGYHYMLHPVAMQNEIEAAIYEQMGHIILEVSPLDGNRMLEQARRALCHQLEIASLAERVLSKKKGTS